MGFLTSGVTYTVKLVNSFQFPLWDSLCLSKRTHPRLTDTFNSLYGIPKINNIYCCAYCLLSIPFMGYMLAVKLAKIIKHLSIPFMGFMAQIVIEQKPVKTFQFPLWDSNIIIQGLYKSKLDFQFPLWDSQFYKQKI